MATTIELRPASPDEEEGRLFARYTDAAADGLMEKLFGKRYECILARAFVTPGHDMSYDKTVFAVLDGEIVGMATAYSADEMGRSSSMPVVRAAGIHVVRMIPISIIGYRLFEFIRTVPEGDYYLAALSVSDDHRGAGIGSQLFADVERRGREAGCHRVALDVAFDNPRAKELYERLGMVAEGASPAIRLMPGDRVHRMIKDL